MEHTDQSSELAATNAADAPPPLDILILAAGLGTRMRSNTAKVLHRLAGRPLIAHVCRTAAALAPRHIYVVVGHQAEKVELAVREEMKTDNLFFVTQAQQRGTGDAVRAAQSVIEKQIIERSPADADSTLLILSGDVPFVRPETLGALVHQHRTHRGRGAACTILTVKLDDPSGYGRILRGEENRFLRIVEQKDASAEERSINEINSGIYCFDARKLFPALARVEPANAQGEYYLTDVPAILHTEGEDVSIYIHTDAREVSGINNRVELAEFERILRLRTLRRLMLDSGVTILDPTHAYVDADVTIGRDTILHPDIYLEGKTSIGEDCVIESGARVINSKIGNNVRIKNHSLIVDCEIGDNCQIGPFAHLRMNAQLEKDVTIGNFVEVKKSRLASKVKANHLTYLGDATVGERTNIGAGTITCNYDGRNKHPTTIEADVKIGSDTMLVAPVRIGQGSVTAAGSVVTTDVPANTLVAGVPAKVKKQIVANEE